MAKRRDLTEVSFRDELAESANIAVNGPPPAPVPEPVAPVRLRQVKASPPPAAQAVEEDEPDLHVTTVKIDRRDYLAMMDIAIDRIRGKKRGSPNFGELMREAVKEYLERHSSSKS